MVGFVSEKTQVCCQFVDLETSLIGCLVWTGTLLQPFVVMSVLTCINGFSHMVPNRSVIVGNCCTWP